MSAALGKRDLDPAHRVGGPRQLPYPDRLTAGGDGAPVDLGRVEQSAVAVRGHHLVAAGLQIAEALIEHVARDQRADHVGRHMPVGVERRVIDGAGEHRRLRRRIGLADDHLHRIGDPAVLDHVQARAGRYRPSRSGPAGGMSRARSRLARTRGSSCAAVRLHRSPRRIAQLGVERVHLRDLADVRGERRRGRGCGRGSQRRSRAAARPTGRRRSFPAGGVCSACDILHPGGREQPVGGGERGGVAGLGAGNQRLRLAASAGPLGNPSSGARWSTPISSRAAGCRRRSAATAGHRRAPHRMR